MQWRNKKHEEMDCLYLKIVQLGHSNKKHTLFCSILILFIIFNLILIIFKENKSESRKNNFLTLLLLNIFRRIQKTMFHTDLSVTVTSPPLPPPNIP